MVLNLFLDIQSQCNLGYIFTVLDMSFLGGGWRKRLIDQGRGTTGVGGTPLYGLYGDVPLDRVWFLASLS